MNIDEVIQQPGVKERVLLEAFSKNLNVAVPGEVVSYDTDARTATIQPTIRDWGSTDDPPLLLDVPVFMWGNYQITPQKGDSCLVIFADRCIDSWLQSGGVSSPLVARFHSMSDGFAFVGFNREGGQDFPTILDSFVKKEDIANNLTTTAEGKVLDARQGKVLGDHFLNLGTETAPVTNLNNIPLNSIGSCHLSADISPSGFRRIHTYIKGGDNANRYGILVIDHYDKKAYIQVNYAGTMSGWKELFNSSEVIPVANGGTGATTASAARANLEAMYGKAVSLGSGDNLNNITTPGFYAITTGVANAPKTWCGLLVVQSGAAVYQFAFSRDRAYVRDYTGDPISWSVWAPISMMGGTLPNGTDLNTIISPGFYLLSSNWTYTNMPTGAAAVLVLRSSTTALFVVQIAFGLSNPQRRHRTDTNAWSTWTAYANDASVVHNTGDETVSGTKTFTYALLFEREAVTVPGTQYAVLRARFKSQNGTVQFEAVPVRVIGNDAANNINAGIAIGSNSGITVVGAGEGSAMFTSKNSVYDGEDMYLVSDGFIRMYTGVANDGTVKGYYQFPTLSAGTAIDISRLLTAINGKMPTTAIPSGADLDTYKTPGSYYIQNSTVAGTLAHCPWTGCGGRIDVIETYNASGNYVRQIGHMGGGNPQTFIRESNSSGTFGAWYKFNLTAV